MHDYGANYSTSRRTRRLVSVSQKRATFLIPLSSVTIPPGSPNLGRCFGSELHLSEFLLQGPISTFVGTTGIGTKYEDVPFAVNLGFGTR